MEAITFSLEEAKFINFIKVECQKNSNLFNSLNKNIYKCKKIFICEMDNNLVKVQYIFDKGDHYHCYERIFKTYTNLDLPVFEIPVEKWVFYRSIAGFRCIR